MNLPRLVNLRMGLNFYFRPCHYWVNWDEISMLCLFSHPWLRLWEWGWESHLHSGQLAHWDCCSLFYTGQYHSPPRQTCPHSQYSRHTYQLRAHSLLLSDPRASLVINWVSVSPSSVWGEHSSHHHRWTVCQCRSWERAVSRSKSCSERSHCRSSRCDFLTTSCPPWRYLNQESLVSWCW